MSPVPNVEADDVTGLSIFFFFFFFKISSFGQIPRSLVITGKGSVDFSRPLKHSAKQLSERAGPTTFQGTAGQVIKSPPPPTPDVKHM